MEIKYKPELPKTTIPIIVIGAGGIVRDAHLPAYKMAGFKVIGIQNKTIEKAQKLAEQYHIPNVYKTVSEAVEHAPEEVIYDLAIMADQFAEVLRQLPNGATVLIQKPLGNTREQTEEILSVCKQKNFTAAVNCQLRYAPYVMAARDLIQSGMLGELYDMEVRLTTYTPWEIFPNVVHHQRLEILNHSVHYIDLIRSFLGEPKGIMAKTLKHPTKKLSSTRTTILFDYGDTMHALVNVNHDHNFGPENQESFIKWEGTKGAIKAKMGLLLDYPKGKPDKFEYCLVDKDGHPKWMTKELEGSWFPEAFIGTMSSVMRYKEGSTKCLPTNVDDVAKTMALVEAAYQSNEHGSTKTELT